jgi:hypothetical protein
MSIGSGGNPLEPVLGGREETRDRILQSIGSRSVVKGRVKLISEIKKRLA